VYDEHGGFYDHVPPPLAERVSDDMPITTYGVRVPVFVVSPWVAPGSVFGSNADTRHFDHTSIMKTIVRRFLADPPYLGRRYASANDLSSVLGSELRMPQFLPFIRYRFQFVTSQTLLDAISEARTPGSTMRHTGGDGSRLQDFCLEETDTGYVYIRNHANGLYLSAPAADSLSGAPTGSTLTQELKYAQASTMSGSVRGPDMQKWKLTRISMAPDDKDTLVVACLAYPDLMLRPAVATVEGNADADAGVIVVGAPLTDTQSTWRVTCPLLT
jgi:hypothetical protein